jgi:hypothetical protein
MRQMRAVAGPVLLGLALLIMACEPGPSVVQGTVVRTDASGRLIVVRDERPPHATMEISIASAEIGADPIPGDSVRVAYRDAGNRFVATRVMNLTRQEEVGKKGGRSGEH